MAGYTGTSLQKKLGIKAGISMFVKGEPAEYFQWISPFPDGAQQKDKLHDPPEFIHVFARDRKPFEKRLITSQQCLQKKGSLWISWPKKSGNVPTDRGENFIRDVGPEHGLVDIKVCAVDEVWSGLKFVFRVKDR